MPALNNYITYSVGDPKQGAANRHDEVETIQGLLNVQIIKDNRGDRLLPITGSVDTDTLRAIMEFQRRRGYPQSGLIQPRDNTFSALLAFSGPRGMRASQSMINSLKQTERFEAQLYNDEAKDCTIGYGHLVHTGSIDGSEPEEFKKGITEARADAIFRDDLRKVEDAVNHLVGVPLTQYQFDALVSFAYNVGAGRGGLEDSTLLKKLNGSSSPREYTGDYLGAAAQFLQWIDVHHRPSEGLLIRRREEERLFLQR